MMESLTAGTIAGAGSFRCQRCGYVLTLSACDTLSDCPSCQGRSFVRASLFSTGRMQRVEDASAPSDPAEREAWLGEVREQIAEQPGEYVVYEESGELIVVPLTREWTRVGRSLAADVRFDDPTVSRRHALIVRQADGVRVLDDRSLNGVFVNGERIEWRVLKDGDEILVGRYRLGFLSVAADPAERVPTATPLHSIG
jgi:predicted  nucleic acid-binding Zn-ribbon protein